MFKLLGVVVLVYAAYGAWHGEIFAKSGPWGRTILREDSPGYFWVVIAVYCLLGLALLLVF